MTKPEQLVSIQSELEKISSIVKKAQENLGASSYYFSADASGKGQSWGYSAARDLDRAAKRYRRLLKKIADAEAALSTTGRVDQ